MSTYARFVELAQEELRLVGEGRWDELRRIDDERRALAATLPAVPPPDAREYLLEAERIVQRTTQFCGLALDDMRAHLARLRSGNPALNSHA